ncbi:MAG: hypothetical protein ABIE03_04190 [Patescibacteria group bacterium]|nr:hypothetical protein [Patescibacteria group bacterium]
MEDAVTEGHKGVELHLNTLPIPFPTSVLNYALMMAGFVSMHLAETEMDSNFSGEPVGYRVDFVENKLVCLVCTSKSVIVIIRSISEETRSFEVQVTGVKKGAGDVAIHISPLRTNLLQGGYCSGDFFDWKSKIEGYYYPGGVCVK